MRASDLARALLQVRLADLPKHHGGMLAVSQSGETKDVQRAVRVAQQVGARANRTHSHRRRSLTGRQLGWCDCAGGRPDAVGRQHRRLAHRAHHEIGRVSQRRARERGREHESLHVAGAARARARARSPRLRHDHTSPSGHGARARRVLVPAIARGTRPERRAQPREGRDFCRARARPTYVSERGAARVFFDSKRCSRRCSAFRSRSAWPSACTTNANSSPRSCARATTSSFSAK